MVSLGPHFLLKIHTDQNQTMTASLSGSLMTLLRAGRRAGRTALRTGGRTEGEGRGVIAAQGGGEMMWTGGNIGQAVEGGGLTVQTREERAGRERRGLGETEMGKFSMKINQSLAIT